MNTQNNPRKQSANPVLHCCLNIEGKKVSAFRCYTVADVDNQPDVPAWSLALISLPPVSDGKLLISAYTRHVLIRLQDTCGAAVCRDCLRSVIADMSHGFCPRNPVGVYVSRCRNSSGVVGISFKEG